MGTTKAWSVGPYLGGWLVGAALACEGGWSGGGGCGGRGSVALSPSLAARETEPRGGWRSSAQHAVLELWRETEEREGGEDCVTTEPANQPMECWINSKLDET